MPKPFVIYLIDNYDSFTYNLYQFVGEVMETAQRYGAIQQFEIITKRNDQVTLDDIKQASPDRIIISPGPGSPDNEAYFGICAQVIQQLGPTIPLLGVCLGMQGIVHGFGGQVVLAHVPMHGKTSPISHNHRGIFTGIPDQLEVMRYHSLMADMTSIPECLEVTAIVGDIKLQAVTDWVALANNGTVEIMAVQHKQYPIYGIQFHPESFATEGGKELIENFLLPPQ